MKFLVFQHIACEHPGIFRDLMREAGVAWDTVELDAGGDIPGLDGYDALLVMGGPMDVWQVSEHPWLEPEMAAIKGANVVMGRDPNCVSWIKTFREPAAEGSEEMGRRANRRRRRNA